MSDVQVIVEDQPDVKVVVDEQDTVLVVQDEPPVQLLLGAEQGPSGPPGPDGSGSGGTVTQATSKTTGVTLNKPTGKITMASSALGANGVVTFSLTNSSIGVGDTVNVNVVGGYATVGTYRAWAEATASGSCLIVVQNISAGTLSEAVQLQFTVQKGATA